MPHSIAIQAFQGINNAPTGALLAQLYGILVSLELISKDCIQSSNQQWTAGHDVCVMLVIVESTLSASCAQLKANLERLHCTDRYGNEANVTASSYPDIRYLRHVDDTPAWPNSSNNQMLQDALNDARLCLQQLKQSGIAP